MSEGTSQHEENKTHGKRYATNYIFCSDACNFIPAPDVAATTEGSRGRGDKEEQQPPPTVLVMQDQTPSPVGRSRSAL